MIGACADARRRRPESTRITFSAKNGVCETWKRNARSSSATSSQAVAAVAVALRFEASISASSPKIPPGPTSSSGRPSDSIVTVPSRTTNMQAPWSPAEKITSPGAKRSTSSTVLKISIVVG